MEGKKTLFENKKYLKGCFSLWFYFSVTYIIWMAGPWEVGENPILSNIFTLVSDISCLIDDK